MVIVVDEVVGGQPVNSFERAAVAVAVVGSY